MGGKIRAYNKITKYAEELARQQHDSGLQDVILSTDQAYWQVVSLASKKEVSPKGVPQVTAKSWKAMWTR